MFTASSTPNQTRSMPSLSATGPSSGTTMKDSSKKSRKNASTKTRMFTTIRKPSWPPGRLVSRCSTQIGAVHALEGQAEHGGADQDEHHEARELHRRVHRLAQQLQAERRRPTAITSAPTAPIAPPSVGRGHAQEDGAQHQEDQRQRRDQHEGHALGHAGEQPEPQHLVQHRQQRRPRPRHAHRDHDQLVGGPPWCRAGILAKATAATASTISTPSERRPAPAVVLADAARLGGSAGTQLRLDRSRSAM